MTHPVLQGMLMMGCKSQQKVLLAFHTYMELCEVKILWNVEYDFNKDLDIIYLRGKTKKNAEQEDIYIPISVSTTVTPSWIEKVQKSLSEKHSNSSFILVIKERDSSSVYYKISPGLVPPLSPESAKKKKSEEEKKNYMERELRKRRTELYKEVKNLAEKENTENKDDSEKDSSNQPERKSSPLIEIIDDQDDIIEL